jgi:hypothetical protein
MNIILFIILSLFVISSFGCTQPAKWQCSKPGLTQTEFKKDNYECSQQSRTNWSGGGSGLIGATMMGVSKNNAQQKSNAIFKECMEVRGYTVVESN